VTFKIKTYSAHATGFTLLELIVVIAGLGILASLATPNFLKYLQSAKNDEAASFLSAVSAECLQNYRNDTTSIDKISTLLDRGGSPRDFNIANGSDKCSLTLISPANESDTNLASFGFMTKLRSDGVPYIYKFGSFAHPDAEGACLKWASFKEDNQGNIIQPRARACDEGGQVEEIRARIAAEAVERERLRLVQARYDAWIAGPPPGTGNYTEDGKNVWAFQGNVVADKAAHDAAVARECGREKLDALNNAISDKRDGPFIYRGKTDTCSINTYLCSGKDVGSKDGYDACKELERQERCTAAEGRWINNGVNGKFSEPGCQVKWQCKNEIFPDQSSYDASACSKKQVCTTVKGSCKSYETNCRTFKAPPCLRKKGKKCLEWSVKKECDTGTSCEKDREVCEWK